jgi:hypothetical protein
MVPGTQGNRMPLFGQGSSNEGFVERRVGAPAIEGTIRDVAAVDVVPAIAPLALMLSAMTTGFRKTTI